MIIRYIACFNHEAKGCGGKWREKNETEKAFFPLIMNFNILKATFRIVGESWDALSARLFWQILHSGFNDVADPLEDIGEEKSTLKAISCCECQKLDKNTNLNPASVCTFSTLTVIKFRQRAHKTIIMWSTKDAHDITLHTCLPVVHRYALYSQICMH